jgi:membrane protein DedA with SNARE-associated domain
VESTLAEILTWLEPHALLLAVALPPVIRIVGHLVPEELFMVATGVLAARSGTAGEAASLLIAVTLSHIATDHCVYLAGRWLRPRLWRFPRVQRRLQRVTRRLSSSPAALLGLIPARVLPLGRGAWLASCGVVGVSWRRFLLADVSALTVHLTLWSGLGWWLGGDLGRLETVVHVSKVTGVWAVTSLALILLLWFGWRRRQAWQPATARAVRTMGRSLRQLGRPD